MSRRQLTHKQHAFLEYLRDHVETRKIWPTYREIVDHFDYRSPNSVTQNLHALSRKGFLERDRNGYRLVDVSGQDGSIDLAGLLVPGRLEPAAASARFSLASLSDGLGGLQAVQLGPGLRTDPELDGATFVLVATGAPEADDLVVVLDGADVRIAPASALGRHPQTTLLGRYAGHAGPYGVVLPAGAAPTAAPTQAAPTQAAPQRVGESSARAATSVNAL